MKGIRTALRTIRVLLGASLAALVLLAWFATIEKSVEVEGEIHAASVQRVRPEVGGLITAVPARPEGRVEAGDALIEIGDLERDREARLLEAELRQAHSALDQARRERLALANQIHPLELERQRTEIDRSSSRIERQRARVEELRVAHSGLVERMKTARSLQEAGLLSRETARERELAVEEASWRLEQAELQIAEELVEVEAGRRALALLTSRHAAALAEIDARITEAQERLLQAEVRHLALEELREREVLRASIGGYFIAPRVSELIGRRAVPGEEIATVLDEDSLLFRARLQERSVVAIAPGQPATVEIRGLPKGEYGSFSGQVVRVGRTPEHRDGDHGNAYLVEIRLDRPWILYEGERFILREGMSGVADIVYRSDVSLLEAAYDFLVGRPGP